MAGAVYDSLPDLVPGAADLLYARIDLVTDDAGRPVVLEVELAEPNLFLPQAPGAADRLASAVSQNVG